MRHTGTNAEACRKTCESTMNRTRTSCTPFLPSNRNIFGNKFIIVRCHAVATYQSAFIHPEPGSTHSGGLPRSMDKDLGLSDRDIAATRIMWDNRLVCHSYMLMIIQIFNASRA